MTESSTPRTDRLNELLDDYADSLEVNPAGFFAHPDSERRAAREALTRFFSDANARVAILEGAMRKQIAAIDSWALITDPRSSNTGETLLAVGILARDSLPGAPK